MAKSSTSKGKRAARAPEPISRPADSSSSSSASPSPSPEPEPDLAQDSSASSDSDRDSSASPEPQIAPARQEHRVLDPEALKYAPPEGYKPIKATAGASGIDWDELKDDADLELWTVRVPAGVKTKHLEGLTLTLPEGNLTDPVQPVGHFTAKKAEYDVYLASVAAPEAAGNNGKRRRDAGAEELEGAQAATAGELQTMVPLLPRKSQGNKLFQAPRPVSRTLTITRSLPASVIASTSALATHNDGHSTLIQSQPSPVPGAILTADELLDADLAAKRKRQVRGDAQRDQPSDLLKFRMGAVAGLGAQGGQGRYNNPMEAIVPSERDLHQFDLAGPAPADAEGDVEMADDGAAAPAVADGAAEPTPKKEKKAKKEKRAKKEDGESPRKKKVKAEA